MFLVSVQTSSLLPSFGSAAPTVYVCHGMPGSFSVLTARLLQSIVGPRRQAWLLWAGFGREGSRLSLPCIPLLDQNSRLGSRQRFRPNVCCKRHLSRSDGCKILVCLLSYLFGAPGLLASWACVKRSCRGLERKHTDT